MRARNSLIAWWLDVWRGNPHTSDMPMQGEHRAARSRVILVGTLTVVGCLVVMQDPTNEEYRRAIPVALLCLVFALLVLYVTKDGIRPRGGLGRTDRTRRDAHPVCALVSRHRALERPGPRQCHP